MSMEEKKIIDFKTSIKKDKAPPFSEVFIPGLCS